MAACPRKSRLLFDPAYSPKPAWLYSAFLLGLLKLPQVDLRRHIKWGYLGNVADGIRRQPVQRDGVPARGGYYPPAVVAGSLSEIERGQHSAPRYLTTATLRRQPAAFPMGRNGDAWKAQTAPGTLPACPGAATCASRFSSSDCPSSLSQAIQPSASPYLPGAAT
jgi:hypothetical protein